MEIPLRRGRLLTSNEVERRAPVALIDERLADQRFADEDPNDRRSPRINHSAKAHQYRQQDCPSRCT